MFTATSWGGLVQRVEVPEKRQVMLCLSFFLISLSKFSKKKSSQYPPGGPNISHQTGSSKKSSTQNYLSERIC